MICSPSELREIARQIERYGRDGRAFRRMQAWFIEHPDVVVDAFRIAADAEEERRALESFLA